MIRFGVRLRLLASASRLATQDLGGSAEFYLLDQPEPGQDIIAAETRSPTEGFFKTFVFCFGAMLVGVVRSDQQ